MEKSGFDKNHPLKIYKHPSGQRVCVNGHYRLKAASQVGMFGIKVFVEEVTFEEASKTTEWQTPDDALILNDVSKYL